MFKGGYKGGLDGWLRPLRSSARGRERAERCERGMPYRPSPLDSGFRRNDVASSKPPLFPLGHQGGGIIRIISTSWQSWFTTPNPSILPKSFPSWFTPSPLDSGFRRNDVASSKPPLIPPWASRGRDHSHHFNIMAIMVHNPQSFNPSKILPILVHPPHTKNLSVNAQHCIELDSLTFVYSAS